MELSIKIYSKVKNIKLKVSTQTKKRVSAICAHTKNLIQFSRFQKGYFPIRIALSSLGAIMA